MLSCELIDDFSRLQKLSSDWDSLWRADPCGEMFQSFAWARAWWQSYGQGLTLCVLSVSDGNRVIGFVPLVRKGVTIAFLGHGQSDYCDIICEDDRAVEVLSASLQQLFQIPGWKTCFLQDLKPEGRVLSHWSELPRQIRDRLQVFPAEDCKTILLDRGRTILDSLIQKNHTRRRISKLRKAGSLTFRHIETKAEAEVQLGYFFQNHVRRHTIAGKRSSAETPEWRLFLQTLVDELDLTDALRFGVLELDGCPLAWHFSFQVNGKLTFYQQTFNVESWEYAPGEVLVHQLLLYAQNNVARELDFTRGDEPFKDRFTTHTRKTYSMYVDRPEFQGSVRQFVRASTFPLIQLGESTKSLAKHYPGLFHTYRSVRLWSSGFLARMEHHSRNLTLMQWGQKAARECLRMTHLDREEMELFVAGPNNRACASQLNPGSVAREGTLGDLVDLTRQHPEILTAFELPKHRKRLKSGDRIYMLWEDGKFALAAWARTRESRKLLDLKLNHSLLHDGQYMLVYDCWSTSDNKVDHYKELLALLSNVAKEKKLRLAVCCPVASLQLRTELVQQGFQPHYRLVRRRTARHFQVQLLAADTCSDAAQTRGLPILQNHFQGTKS
jgi:CelD/BcsL family acetyltransferase involved in cellulose biosynthesis